MLVKGWFFDWGNCKYIKLSLLRLYTDQYRSRSLYVVGQIMLVSKINGYIKKKIL